MATMAEIRRAIADDLASAGFDTGEVLAFEDEFDRNLRFREDSLLVTTDINLLSVHGWCDQQPTGNFLSVIHTEVGEFRYAF
jgi:hypothetical protein